MHIMEGFLPVEWAIFWSLMVVPVLIFGMRKVSKLFAEHPEQKLTIALGGAFIALLSSLKLPSVTGSSSHPTGTGASTILYGPAVTAVLATIVLVFQALLLAHGGITTLGANIFSMGIAGPSVAYGIFMLMSSAGVRRDITVFVVTSMADLFTYVVTSLQLALAFPGSNFVDSFATFLGTFAVTQIPLSVVEGVLFVMFFQFLASSRPHLIRSKFKVAA
jgi:cobalamin biosynthesis protein CbiM